MTYHFGKSFLPTTWREKKGERVRVLAEEEKGEGDFSSKRLSI